jgi:two-component system alkaline phosphatase synthesis response regulator PhoP
VNENKKILVIDDEASMIEALSKTFTTAGFVVLTASNGEEGLEIALKEQPDLILLDLLMPKLDGRGTLTNLRQDEWGKNVPVIILTNVSPDADQTLQSITEHQPAYYLVKPEITLLEIVEKVKDVLHLPQK